MAMKVKPDLTNVTSTPETNPAHHQMEHAKNESKEMTDPSKFIGSLSSLCTATPTQDEYLPVVKLLWAIEAQNSPDKYEMAHVGKLLLTSGGSYEVLEPGTLFTVLSSRNSIRKLVDTEDGGKDYSRAYAKIGTVESLTDQTYKANCDNPEWQKGVAVLVAIIKGDGAITLATWEMYKADPSYFFAKLMPASLHGKMGLKIDEPNHMKNLKPNKQGTGSYLDKSKFTKHALVPLTPEQVQAIANLVIEKQKLFQAWLEK